jgi:hypothetical protein
MLTVESIRIADLLPHSVPILPSDGRLQEERERTADAARECLDSCNGEVPVPGPGVVPWFIRSVEHGW